MKSTQLLNLSNSVFTITVLYVIKHAFGAPCYR